MVNYKRQASYQRISINFGYASIGKPTVYMIVLCKKISTVHLEVFKDALGSVGIHGRNPIFRTSIILKNTV